MSLTPPPGRPAPADAGGRQLSLFGVEAVEPSPADLSGLLVAGGQIVRMGGTARVSVLVADAWRVHVLMAELRRRGINATWTATPGGGHEVRTAYATGLAPLAAAWLSGTTKRPPAGFHLNGPRLRLWAATGGGRDPGGYLLRLGPDDEACRAPAGAALAAVGLSATLVGAKSGDPGYRVTGRRRLARLAELMGERPAATPAEQWPQPD